jgi:uncharacterized protein
MCRLSVVIVCGIVAAVGTGAGAREVMPQAAPDRLFVWKVTSKTNTAYLLGSVPVGSEDFYPLPQEVEDAFKDSKVLVVEVDPTKVDAAEMQAAMVDRGMYIEGDTIARHVPRPTLQKLRAYFSRRGLPAAQMERFRPWALAVTVTVLETQGLGYRAELGVDKYFMDRSAGRPVVELESASAQIDLLSGFPEKLEAEFLASTLDGASKTKEMMEQTVALWRGGDAEGLEKLLVTEPLKKQPGMKGVYAKRFDERNANMAEKVAGFLKKPNDPHFVVVGAGHLVGDKGILKLLERKGYHVSQVTRAAKSADDAGTAERRRSGYVPKDAWSK